MILSESFNLLRRSTTPPESVSLPDGRDPKLQLLLNVVGHIQAGRVTAASLRLKHLLAWGLDLNRQEDLPYAVFSAALLRRLHGEAWSDAHLYMQDHPVPQIRLFNLLATRVPQVYLAGQIANELLCTHARGAREVSLVDVGMGTGRQMVAVLERMAALGIRPERLHLVGIEPAAAALAQAEQDVLSTAARLGMRVTFQGMAKPAEALTASEWTALRTLPGKRLVNESFALHHLPARDGRELRQDVLERLREVAPAAFVLSEPNSNHLEADFQTRFLNSWEHFGLTFRTLDALDLDADERKALKTRFFGREIEDIIAQPEGERSERHELATTWCDRLERAGFQLELDGGSVAGIRDEANVVQTVLPGGRVDLCFEGQTLVSVLCAVSGTR